MYLLIVWPDSISHYLYTCMLLISITGKLKEGAAQCNGSFIFFLTPMPTVITSYPAIAGTLMLVHKDKQNCWNSGATNTFISASYWHWWHRCGRDPLSMGSLLIQSGYRHPSSYWFILTGYSCCICLRVLPACAPFLANENQAWAFKYMYVCGRAGRMVM